MSDLQYNSRIQAVHVLFTSAKLQNGALAVRQGLPFGARYGAVLIGPDISLPGGTTAATGLIWSTQAGPGRPNVTFVQDLN